MCTKRFANRIECFGVGVAVGAYARIDEELADVKITWKWVRVKHVAQSMQQEIVIIFQNNSCRLVSDVCKMWTYFRERERSRRREQKKTLTLRIQFWVLMKVVKTRGKLLLKGFHFETLLNIDPPLFCNINYFRYHTYTFWIRIYKLEANLYCTVNNSHNSHVWNICIGNWFLFFFTLLCYFIEWRVQHIMVITLREAILLTAHKSIDTPHTNTSHIHMAICVHSFCHIPNMLARSHYLIFNRDTGYIWNNSIISIPLHYPGTGLLFI